MAPQGRTEDSGHADAVREALRAEAAALDFRTLYKQPLGRYYFLMYVRDVAPAQGDFLLGVGRYRSSRLERREIARACSTATRPR